MFVIRYSIPYVGQSMSIGEISSDPGGLTHRWMLKALIPIGFALFALQAAAQGVAAARRLSRAPAPDDAAGSGSPSACCVGFFVMLMAGVPVGITLAASGFVFGFLGFGETLFHLLPARIYGVVANYQWLAIPLFVFMGVMLEKSRLAEDLLDVIGHLAGGLRGGMAIGIIAGRRADGRHHRHRRRDRDHARPADAADPAAARLRPGDLVRRDLRLGHAGPDHSAEPGADPALRHHAALGGHAVRRRRPAGADAGRRSTAPGSRPTASCGPS